MNVKKKNITDLIAFNFSNPLFKKKYRIKLAISCLLNKYKDYLRSFLNYRNYFECGNQILSYLLKS